jgi:heptose-I-phosphate ethanolaminephosphotransferase
VASLFCIFETNPSESSQFLSAYLSADILLVLSTYIITALTLLFFIKSRKISPNIKILLVFSAILGFTPYAHKIDIGDRTITGPLEEFIEACQLYNTEIKAYKAEARKRKQNIAFIETKSLDLSEDQLFVLIIGESTNRNHMQLYGYHRETNPILTSMKDQLLIFTDVISSHTDTLPVLENALTFANTDNGRKYYQVYSIIYIARAAGFKTYWLSNQYPVGIWDNTATIMGKTADETIFVNFTDKSTKWARSKFARSFDEKIFHPFDIVLQEKYKKKFIVIHLMGAHVRYDQRYPSTFEKYNTDINTGDKKKSKMISEINTYDNAILYNDFIVSQIIKKSKIMSNQNNIVSSVIYFSDHGEEVFDSKDFIGHHWSRISRHQVEIPFIVWTSERFKEVRYECYEAMAKNIEQPYVTDNLIHSILDILGITSSQYKAKSSLFNFKFLPKKRIVIGKDYDLELRTQ